MCGVLIVLVRGPHNLPPAPLYQIRSRLVHTTLRRTRSIFGPPRQHHVATHLQRERPIFHTERFPSKAAGLRSPSVVDEEQAQPANFPSIYHHSDHDAASRSHKPPSASKSPPASFDIPYPARAHPSPTAHHIASPTSQLPGLLLCTAFGPSFLGGLQSRGSLAR